MKNKHLVTFILGIMIALIVSSCGKSNDSLTFNISFKNSNNLNKGQFVVYKGIRIGEVTDIALKDDGQVYVTVKIAPEFKEKTYKEAEFIIEKPGGFLDMSGEKQITMTDHEGTHTSLKEGDVVRGYDGLLDHLIGKAADFGKAAYTWAGNMSQYVIQSIGEFAQSPEAKNFVAALKNYGEKAKTLSEEQYDKFKQDELPKLLEDGRKLKEQMEKEGQTEKAQKFWDELTSSVDKINK